MTMEVRAITANAQVQVSGGEGHFSAELDGRAWGFNGGRTQYYPGDTAYLLFYISKNVNVVGTALVGGSDNPPLTFNWVHPNSMPPFNENSDPQSPPPYPTVVARGYNIQRESINFNTPVANFSKPAMDKPRILGSSFKNCGDPKFIKDTTIVRLGTWSPTLSPLKVPPHGFLFVEYEPSFVVGKLSNLGIPKGIKVFSFPNTVIVYGVATPMLPSSGISF